MENQSVAQKLEALVKLQYIDTKLDELKKLRGDLPDEVQDLEDEIEGYRTRQNKYEAGQREIEDNIKKHKEAIKEAVDRFGGGSSGSPILSGTTELHEELARELNRSQQAEFFPVAKQGMLRQGRESWIAAGFLHRDDRFPLEKREQGKGC